MRILCVAGARPNFMKIAPILAALNRRSGIEPLLVHTGQHYDQNMCRIFFDELGLPRPDVELGVGGGSHVHQIAETMRAFETVLGEHAADLVVVVGDVNSTLACALAAAKCGVPVAHVEAGLRSGDRSMPEEINRIVTDQLSDTLFATEPAAVRNLRAEGIPESRVHLVGNVMIDTLLAQRERAAACSIVSTLGLNGANYALLTLHRPGNVDVPEVLGRLVGAVCELARDVPIVWPVHPRTRSRLEGAGLWSSLAHCTGLRLTPPLGYLEFLRLMDVASVVLTDSGGIQEETTALGVPCVTLRDCTERPITVEQGTNVLVGTEPHAILKAAHSALARKVRRADVPDLWDGHAAERIVCVLLGDLPAKG